MSNPRYPEAVKIRAVNQVTEKQLPVAEVAARLLCLKCEEGGNGASLYLPSITELGTVRYVIETVYSVARCLWPQRVLPCTPPATSARRIGSLR